LPGIMASASRMPAKIIPTINTSFMVKVILFYPFRFNLSATRSFNSQTFAITLIL
jgi:hypothetical protein